MAAPEQALTSWVPEDTFAVRLTLVRRHLDLSQMEAAQACGLDDGSWSNWERGAKPRGQDSVVKAISEGLGVDRDWLMWGGPLRSRCFYAAGHFSRLEVVPVDPGQGSLLDEHDAAAFDFSRPLTLTSLS